jgi:hypothetical protein
MLEARRRLEQRPEAEWDSEDREEDGPKGGDTGSAREPEAHKQINLTDADDSQLVLWTDVLETPSDANELETAIAKVPEKIGAVKKVLTDGGYVNAEVIKRSETWGIEAYMAISDEEQNVRRYDYRPPKERKPKTVKKPQLVKMREKLRTEEGRKIYAKRARAVEPVFGIIKAPMGFRQFLLRGLEKMRIEWDLVCLAYNMKRLYNL